MDLKNRRIAVRIDDPELRYQLSELLNEERSRSARCEG